MINKKKEYCASHHVCIIAFNSNYRLCYAINVLIAILQRQIRVDHTNSCIHRDRWNDHTVLRHRIDANLNRTMNVIRKKNKEKRERE